LIYLFIYLFSFDTRVLHYAGCFFSLSLLTFVFEFNRYIYIRTMKWIRLFDFMFRSSKTTAN